MLLHCCSPELPSSRIAPLLVPRVRAVERDLAIAALDWLLPLHSRCFPSLSIYNTYFSSAAPLSCLPSSRIAPLVPRVRVVERDLAIAALDWLFCLFPFRCFHSLSIYATYFSSAAPLSCLPRELLILCHECESSKGIWRLPRWIWLLPFHPLLSLPCQSTHTPPLLP